MLKIKNTTDSDFVDRYDGRDYIFPSGKTVRVMEDVAHHIFGFGEADKTPYLLRLGWVRTSSDLDSGMEKLGKFLFSVVEYQEENDDLPAPTPISPGVVEAPDETATGIVDNSGESAPKRGRPLGGRSILSNLTG